MSVSVCFLGTVQVLHIVGLQKLIIDFDKSLQNG